MKIDTRILLIGSSGSGKTNLLLNYIALCQNTFQHIHVIFKSFEPLYELLRDKLEKSGGVTFYDDINKLPDLDKIQIEKDDQQLVIFDDQINEKEKLNGKVAEYAIRGRKKRITMIFIAQSYFKIPKIIRQQIQYLMILKLSSVRDLRLILSDFGTGKVDEMEQIYIDATKQQFDFFKIDVDQQDDNKKFSKNFTDFYTLTNT